MSGKLVDDCGDSNSSQKTPKLEEQQLNTGGGDVYLPVEPIPEGIDDVEPIKPVPRTPTKSTVVPGIIAAADNPGITEKDAQKVFKKEAQVDLNIQAKISRKNVGMGEKPTPKKKKDIKAIPELTKEDITQDDDEIKYGQTEFLLQTIRDFFLYSILVAVITVIAISSMPVSRFYYHDVFTHFLTDAKFKTQSGLSKNFWEIRILDQIWDYLKEILIPLIYSSVGDAMAQTYMENLRDPSSHLLVNENILVVLPRIRQVRVRNDSCQVPLGFVYIFDTCYYFFSSDQEDTNPFGIKQGTLWTWQNSSVTKASSIRGEISTYTGGGYFMDFSFNKSETDRQYSEMWDNTWIDHGSRAIIIDVVGYTQRDNLFCIVTLLFEIPPSGGVITSGDIRVQKLLRYVSTGDYIILGFEVALLTLLVYYTVEEIGEIIFLRLRYFKNPWNIFDLFVIILGYTTLGIGIWRYFIVEERLKGLREAMDNKDFFSFHGIRDVQTAYEILIGCLALVVWLKIFKYIYVVQPGALILRAFYKVRMELLALTLMLLLLVFGFAMFAHVIFGTHVEEFNSIGNSMFTLIALFVGGLFFYDNCEEARPLLAPAFFVVYIFVVILLFLNWFAAAIVHGLKRAAKDFDATSDDEQVFLIDILRNALKKLFLHLKCKRMYTKMDQADTSYSKRPDKEIIINLLKRNGFSVLERALFLKRHGITEDIDVISKSKVDDIIADLNGMNKLYIEVEEHAEILDQVDKIKKRLEVLDHALSDMVVKVDVMIDKIKYEEDLARRPKV